ncbi:MAG TPA: diguanylate cyclase, partial [Azospirillaceae bacterium]|nr:diguanylate cyclase [Azospirillaceae bacterium]
AERLRAAISQAPLAAAAPGRRLTASVGVACLREGESFDFLLGRADEAMYRAKKAGRNQICVAEKDLQATA